MGPYLKSQKIPKSQTNDPFRPRIVPASSPHHPHSRTFLLVINVSHTGQDRGPGEGPGGQAQLHHRGGPDQPAKHPG